MTFPLKPPARDLSIWLFFYSVLVAAGLTVKLLWWWALGYAIP